MNGGRAIRELGRDFSFDVQEHQSAIEGFGVSRCEFANFLMDLRSVIGWLVACVAKVLLDFRASDPLSYSHSAA